MKGRISEIRARMEAATPGPWKWEGPVDLVDGSQARCLAGDGLVLRHEALTWKMHEPDAALIANAPADIAYLLDRVEALEGAATEGLRLAHRVGRDEFDDDDHRRGDGVAVEHFIRQQMGALTTEEA
jgi:hypothetical protein